MEALHEQKLTIRRSGDGARTPAPGVLPSVPISTVSGDGEYVTFTTAQAHGVLQWEAFTVSGCDPDVYNGYWIAAEVTGNTIKVYSEIEETLITPGLLTPETPHESLARFSYPLHAPAQEPLPVPILGLGFVAAGLNWAVANPGLGNSYQGQFTNYLRFLRDGEQVWERHVSMDASLAMDSESTPHTTFVCNATWAEAGTSEDFSLPLPELPIDEITRDEWCDDREDPKVWLEIGDLALNQFEVLEPCGVRDG